MMNVKNTLIINMNMKENGMKINGAFNFDFQIIIN